MKRSILKTNLYFNYFVLFAITLILAGCETLVENPLVTAEDGTQSGGNEMAFADGDGRWRGAIFLLRPRGWTSRMCR